ncbi:MAG TPA: response regulator [Candidatus Thermoplasmatota archaeon]|nr:response regulator [Candidatus Thermoplasmatota archaeon]
MPDLKPAILWAEDSTADQALIQVALDSLPDPPPVRFVPDGRQLLASLRKGTPRIVVLDVRMPGMSGLEALAALRREPQTRELPVILFTSTQDPEEMVKAVSLGIDAFVHKPADPDAFQKAVQRIVASTLRARRSPVRDSSTPCTRCGHPAKGRKRFEGHLGPNGTGRCGARDCPCQGWMGNAPAGPPGGWASPTPRSATASLPT